MVSSGAQGLVAVVVWSGAQGLAVVAASSAVQALLGREPLPPSAPCHDDRPDDDFVVFHAVVDVDVGDADDDVKQGLLSPSTAEIGTPKL